MKGEEASGPAEHDAHQIPAGGFLSHRHICACLHTPTHVSMQVCSCAANLACIFPVRQHKVGFIGWFVVKLMMPHEVSKP